jgi:hypothetical protein
MLDPRMMYQDSASRPLNLTRGVFNLLTGAFYCREYDAKERGVLMMMLCDDCGDICPVALEYLGDASCEYCDGAMSPLTYSAYRDLMDAEREAGA